MAENSFSTFPSCRTEALAMLYLQNQDLTGKTPVEIQEMFLLVCKELREDYCEKQRSGWLMGR